MVGATSLGRLYSGFLQNLDCCWTDDSGTQQACSLRSAGVHDLFLFTPFEGLLLEGGTSVERPFLGSSETAGATATKPATHLWGLLMVLEVQ